MNAIDQYVAPAPVRPDPKPQQQGNGAANADNGAGKSFGDVYNRAANANGNQSDASSADDGKAADAADTPAPTDPKATAVPSETKAASAAGMTSALLKLAAEAKSGEPVDKSDGKKGGDPKTKSAADEKDGKKADASGGKQTLLPETNLAPVVDEKTSEADNAAAALKLLGATQRGKSSAADDASLDAKAKAADDKATDNAAKTDDAKADAAGALLAASLAAVNGQGQHSAEDQKQGKQQPDETTKGKSAQAVAGSEATAAMGEIDDLSAASKDISAKPETVSVLDARRFIGSGQVLSANTQAVVSGMKGDGDWAAAMKAASAAATALPEHKTATPVNTLKIQMTPESLGNVTATLRLHGDQLTVHLTVESGEAFKQLSHDKDGLVQSLKAQGFSVDQVSIQLTPASADKSVAQSSAGQQSGGQQMQDGSSAGQFAQQGRGQENNRRQQENGVSGFWQGDDKSMVGDSGSVASDAPRSGQVYL